MRRRWSFSPIVLGFAALMSSAQAQQTNPDAPAMVLDHAFDAAAFPLFDHGHAAAIYVAEEDSAPVHTAARAFAEDIRAVSGVQPLLESKPEGGELILVGTLGHSAVIDGLARSGKIDIASIAGKWEAASVTVVDHPLPGVRRALVIAGSDPRGAAYALFGLSRAIGVSPWSWWADVPVAHHSSAAVAQPSFVQAPPAVQYRGIFINDEDWGIRPWAAKKMDPALRNIGPNTYARVFELLLRLHANTLWPAMHPGTMPFHAVAKNAKLASEWGIVMGSSHSEALLRDNVGEWDEGRDGPWNYQLNRDAIDRYWDEGLKANGGYENFYTVGMRGQHDTGLEATGSNEVKARLVEQAIADQRAILAKRVGPDLEKIPQVIWLYKESIDLYRVGMKVPEDVTLGWTDDNFGYLRQLPSAEERARSGGNALYYHVSYWGTPHDYLWLCSTPPALMREELTKAWDHGVRKLWVLNVGDIKPAESDIEYFLRMAWQEPTFRDVSQPDYLRSWYTAQFGSQQGEAMASLMDRWYRLTFLRKPEFMGFNGYDDAVQRTEFNPLAWGDQNRQMMSAWTQLADEARSIGERLQPEHRDAFFELVGYPVEASSAHALKFLWTDRSYLDQHSRDFDAVAQDSDKAKAAYNRVQSLTADYNALAGGKWDGMMSSSPRERRVFEMPETATVLATAPLQLPGDWRGPKSAEAPAVSADGFIEKYGTVSIDATHFAARTPESAWEIWPDLGLPDSNLQGGSVSIDRPGAAEPAAWVSAPESGKAAALLQSPSLRYDFTVTSGGEATASIYLLPTFPVDSSQRLRYAMSIDDQPPVFLDAAGAEAHRPDLSAWSLNVLRNAMVQTAPLGTLAPGKHTLVIRSGDPGVIFEHLTVTFPGAVPAYPFAPETLSGSSGVKR
ncbi:glycosyl hydrolase 115 family protein [Silvibacterium sp.]|uniref:glycosyl hydrolase 115 family protein n=1 Tax=Silvibacterium sp. TaxID=1964179 RepID=UPI0039E43796